MGNPFLNIGKNFNKFCQYPTLVFCFYGYLKKNEAVAFKNVF